MPPEQPHGLDAFHALIACELQKIQEAGRGRPGSRRAASFFTKATRATVFIMSTPAGSKRPRPHQHERRVLAVLLPSNFFGEMAILDGLPSLGDRDG